MLNAMKAHLLDPDYERVKFYALILAAIVATAAVVTLAGMHCGGAVISDGAARWSY